MKCLDLPRALLSAGAGSLCQYEWLFGTQVIIYCWTQPKAMLFLAAHSPQPPTGNVFSFQIPLWPKRNSSKNSNKHWQSLLFCRKIMSLGLKWNILWLIYPRSGTGSGCGVWESARGPGEGYPSIFATHLPVATQYITNVMFPNNNCKRARCLILLSLSLISPIKIVCATNPSCIAGTLLASKYNPNVNSLELRAACQEMNNLCKAKQTVYWRGGVGCRWGMAGLRSRQAQPDGHQSCFCQRVWSHVICFPSPLTQLCVKLLILPGSSARAFQQAGEADICALPIPIRPLRLCERWVWRSQPLSPAVPLSPFGKWGKWAGLEVCSVVSLAADRVVAGLSIDGNSLFQTLHFLPFSSWLSRRSRTEAGFESMPPKT